MAGVNLQAIYNRLAAAPRYHPMSANTFADWTMEAGDIVTVSRDGTGYASPVGTMTMKWNGKQQIQISSEGSKEREPISRVSAREYARGGGGASGMRGSQELYWEMFSEDGQLHAQIHATAEALTSDYSKKIGNVDDALRGVIKQTAERLTIDYTDKISNTESHIEQTAKRLTIDYSQKIGDVDDALRGVIKQTAERLTIDYTDKISNTESHIEQTAKQIRTSIANMDDRLSTQINQTDRTVSMSVGRVKYTSVVHKANKDAFPSPGQAGTLYYADDTGRAYLYLPGTHSYELAQVDEYGNANYIKAGEIAISINESGQTEAKLDATRVLAGKGALTIDDLELPDWMDTTEGLIATKATIVDLNALRARVGTLETDTLKTSALYSAISNLDTVRVKKLSVASGGNIKFEGNNVIFTDSTAANIVTNLKIEFNSSTNTYTLSKYTQDDGGEWTAVGSFSRATSLSGAWSGGELTVTASPQGSTLKAAIESVIANGTVTYANGLINVPLKVTGKVGSGSTADTGYTQDFKVLPTAAFNAQSMSGSWSGGTATLSVSPGSATGTAVIDSVLGNGTVTYSGGLLNVPLKVMGKIGNGSQTETGYTQDFKVSPSAAFNAQSMSGSWSNGTATFGVSPGSASGTAKIDSILANGAVTYDSTNKLLKVPLKVMGKIGNGSQTETGFTTNFSVAAGAAYNAGFDADHTLVIADHEGTTQSSISLDPGDTMDIWPGMALTNGTSKKWGSKVSISVSSGGGGEPGSISIGDILATSYPTGTVARQISDLLASTSEDAVQFKVTCTCGAKKTYYIEVP